MLSTHGKDSTSMFVFIEQHDAKNILVYIRRASSGYPENCLKIPEKTVKRVAVV